MTRGEKWLRAATHITAEDRASVIAECQRARLALVGSRAGYGPQSVGIRPAAYIGGRSAVACVTYGPGGSCIFNHVYSEGSR
jgi:hypothetical protein